MMMEPSGSLLRLAGLLAVVALLGCGKATPPRGSFKRSPDPVAAETNSATQANPAAQANPASGAATPPGKGPAAATVSPSGAPILVPALPAAASIKIEPIDAAWPPEKKLEQTTARLKKISLAIREYALKEGRFPAAPGQKHSWRVLLLPYLGHAEQFARFKLPEPWDSPANMAAAGEVPEVYKSPWRSDGLTCFLAPLGPNTVLASPIGVDAARLNDKWSAIIELLMVDDEFAVAWSKPADFVLAVNSNPTGSLGRDRGGYLVVLADSEVRWLPTNVAATSVSALMTIGGDEFASPAVHTHSPLAGLPFLGIAASTGPSTETSKVASAAAKPETEPTAQPSPGDVPSTLRPEKQDDLRAPLPDEAAVEQARSLLKQVFKDEIEKTHKGDKLKSKHDLAEELVKNAQKVEGEPAAHFVLLQTARDNAAAVGDFKLAHQATSALIQRYQVNDLELRRRTVTESAKSLLPHYEQQNDELRTESEQVLKLALQHDDFAAAKELLGVLTETTRRRKPDRNGDQNAFRQQLQRLQSVEKEIDDRKKAYQDVPPALKTLGQTPDDPTAHYTLGAYLCLVKLRWQEGAPHLTKGSNLRLKVLATEDLAPPVGPIGMVDLANEYWTLSEQETSLFKRGLQLRAVYWYRQALPNLSSSLAKVQAERRSSEADKSYGKALVKEALAMMGGPEPIRTAVTID